jgi:hypothetical protein
MRNTVVLFPAFGYLFDIVKRCSTPKQLSKNA